MVYRRRNRHQNALEVDSEFFLSSTDYDIMSYFFLYYSIIILLHHWKIMKSLGSLNQFFKKIHISTEQEANVGTYIRGKALITLIYDSVNILLTIIIYHLTTSKLSIFKNVSESMYNWMSLAHDIVLSVHPTIMMGYLFLLTTSRIMFVKVEKWTKKDLDERISSNEMILLEEIKNGYNILSLLKEFNSIMGNLLSIHAMYLLKSLCMGLYFLITTSMGISFSYANALAVFLFILIVGNIFFKSHHLHQTGDDIKNLLQEARAQIEKHSVDCVTSQKTQLKVFIFTQRLKDLNYPLRSSFVPISKEFELSLLLNAFAYCVTFLQFKASEM
ncbi:unnamed protein product [Lepeophtheirus salmonis]|uniref:(salmon louse) hypothetical protein n=1 Tax=Lepeophtheirus salmonis TaxID=72036 RepID=A0A7R8CEZ1_LEPSM|nr:unnamed protein product [Lepeophtheirus salmonis]CAF2801469.1 unnamed protein product [Lepeophtheirus salmonis]